MGAMQAVKLLAVACGQSPQGTIRFGTTAKVLAELMLRYHRISLCRALGVNVCSHHSQAEVLHQGNAESISPIGLLIEFIAASDEEERKIFALWKHDRSCLAMVDLNPWWHFE